MALTQKTKIDMKTIKDFLLISFGLTALTSAIAGIVTGAWHLLVIAILASVSYMELTSDQIQKLK